MNMRLPKVRAEEMRRKRLDQILIERERKVFEQIEDALAKMRAGSCFTAATALRAAARDLETVGSIRSVLQDTLDRNVKDVA